MADNEEFARQLQLLRRQLNEIGDIIFNHVDINATSDYPHPITRVQYLEFAKGLGIGSQLANAPNGSVLTADDTVPGGLKWMFITAGSGQYVHSQVTAAATWTINHNLGGWPIIQLYTFAGDVFDAEVDHISTAQAVVYLSTPATGYARCVLSVPSSAYLHTQATASTLWTVNHNLGYRPIVQSSDSSGNIIDGKVTHVNANQLTISFNIAQSGQARCI